MHYLFEFKYIIYILFFILFIISSYCIYKKYNQFKSIPVAETIAIEEIEEII